MNPSHRLPSDEQLDRARSLHESGFTFDFVPMGGPIVMSMRHEAIMRRELARGASLGATLRAMMNDRLAEVDEIPETRRLLADTWRRSGVKTIQATLGGIEVDPCGWDAIVRDLAWYAHAERVSGMLKICRSSAELAHAAAGGVLGVLLGTQDAGWCDSRLERLETAYQAGLRVLQLTYNQRNVFGDGCSEPANAGLSRLGEALVRRAGELGVIVDVSHCGDRTGVDAIRTSRRPIAVTHAACRALNPHPRAKPDDFLRALRDGGGYLGIVAIPAFLRPDEENAAVGDMVRHVEHAATIVGIENVGIATDWGGVTPDMPGELAEATRQAFIRAGFKPQELPRIGASPAGFQAWTEWPRITAALLHAGFSEETVRGLIGGNWLRFMDRHATAGH